MTTAAAGSLAQSEVPNPVESKWGHRVSQRGEKRKVCTVLVVEEAGTPDLVPKIKSNDHYIARHNIVVRRSKNQECKEYEFL